MMSVLLEEAISTSDAVVDIISVFFLQLTLSSPFSGSVALTL